MKFKLKIPRVVLCFLAGAVWTILFWLAVTVFPVELSVAALVVLCVTTVFLLKDKLPAQSAMNLAAWFAGLTASAAIEYTTDFPHVLLPDWNGGTGLGVILFLPLFIGTGALTITAAMIISLTASRKR